MQAERPDVFLLITVLSAVTDGLVILYGVSFFRAVVVSPGRIPDLPPWNTITDKESVKLCESKRSGGYRYCRWCRLMKPDRAHHCRACDRCTLKMDHHCPWLDNCIGFGNHKFFLLTLFYSSLALLAMSGSCGWLGYYIMHSTSLLGVDMGRLVIGIVVSGVTGLVGLLVAVFFGIHISLILRGVTTLEVFEKGRAEDSNDGSCMSDLCCEERDPRTNKRLRNVNIYQLPSITENLKAAIGDDMLFWLLPTTPVRITGSTDGLTFRLSSDFERKAVEEGADSPLIPLT